MEIDKKIIALICIVFFNLTAQAQKPTDGIYVDKQGIIRWKSSNKEAAFFGVNYTAPFAYAFRAHKALNVDLEKAIEQDVYHMARLGLDAFRVHVWDTEITDSVGNLLNNEHLRLFDYLISELKKRNIKTLVTPLAFWGNGYPERNENTPGFSTIYNKEQVLLSEKAIAAQEKYLKQFFEHVNPYTKLTYRDDPDIIAAEVNNEPGHSGPKPAVTAYINRMVSAIKSTGFKKPVFYNISQGPWYAAAVANANIDGVSFQWYPAGLVANRELKGNYLPNVDQYPIPYDTIPAYAGKAKMVYEFDAADILQSYMYPAIARSFRTAGFQWATQFAYDPMAIAYANTEYQTHYLNLAYTPSKAISLMIASKAFHKLPRLKTYGTYPRDSTFDVFRVSYKEALSEMNSETEFYYSNSTQTKPASLKTLKNIAGVGSSCLVSYKGYGAYFLDKLENGVWRLEVMPDAIHIRDPFERASLKKEVTRIQYQNQQMQLTLPDLGADFSIKGLNETNSTSLRADKSGFLVSPGTYLLTRKGKEPQKWTTNFTVGSIKLTEFVAPKTLNNDVYLVHQPYAEISAGRSIKIYAKIVAVDSSTKVTVYVNTLEDQYRTIQMKAETAYDYSAEIPADILTPGMLNYRIVVQKGNDFSVYPGNHKGNPFAWDNFTNQYWQTPIAAEGSILEVFNPVRDKTIKTYPAGWGGAVKSGFISGSQPQQLIWNINASKLSGDHTAGMQHYFADKLKGRWSEIDSYKKLVIRARSNSLQPVNVRIALINKDAASFASFFSVSNEFKDIEIPFSNLQSDASMLLPRPYPEFMPLWFKSSSASSLKLTDAEKLEVTIGSDVKLSEWNKPYNLQIESIWFKK